AGATIIVAGAAIYGAADPAAAAAEITAIAHGGSTGGLFGWIKKLFS
ncbi:MAG: 3-hexulose-6-phosphate synthase, partial [Methylotenera sp.]